MTNGDYIRSMMTDRMISEMYFGKNAEYFLDSALPFLQQIDEVFNYWSSFDGKDTGNVIMYDSIPSIWQWKVTYNSNTQKWTHTGRTDRLSFQQWLFMQYDKNYWNKAINEFDKKNK